MIRIGGPWLKHQRPQENPTDAAIASVSWRCAVTDAGRLVRCHLARNAADGRIDSFSRIPFDDTDRSV